MKSKTFIVLGMHRSTTSLIAKALHLAGIDMGAIGERKQYGTDYGFYEDMDFIKMNNILLKEAGGNWKNLPSHEAILQAGCNRKQGVERLINKKKKEMWGWKDPQTILTLECYLPFLEDVHLLAVFRDRRLVAKSMYKRDRNDREISMEKALELADEYNRRLLDLLKKNKERSWLA